MSASHLELVGDSIFDNSAYVLPGHSVTEQLRSRVGAAAQVTLLAADGHLSRDVPAQIAHMPRGATHIALSVGGNDALECLPRLEAPCQNVLQALASLSEIQRQFEVSYRSAFRSVYQTGIPLMVCTVYDCVPGLTLSLKTALSLFNDVITRTALEIQVPILDLRCLMQDEGDFSSVSPIEPSEAGGKNITDALNQWVLGT